MKRGRYGLPASQQVYAKMRSLRRLDRPAHEQQIPGSNHSVHFAHTSGPAQYKNLPRLETSHTFLRVVPAALRCLVGMSWIDRCKQLSVAKTQCLGHPDLSASKKWTRHTCCCAHTGAEGNPLVATSNVSPLLGRVEFGNRWNGKH